MCGRFSEEEVSLDPTWMAHVVTGRWKERCGAVRAVFEEIVLMGRMGLQGRGEGLGTRVLIFSFIVNIQCFSFA